jgi:hypothetical protein
MVTTLTTKEIKPKDACMPICMIATGMANPSTMAVIQEHMRTNIRMNRDA